MNPNLDSNCHSLVQLMKLAPEAITEIDDLLKRDLPGAVASRLNRIVAALYEISLLQDQIARHLTRSVAGNGQKPEPQSWASYFAPKANSVQNGPRTS